MSRAVAPNRHGPHGRRYWPDGVFRIALLVWLIFGLVGIFRNLLAGRSSVAYVVLVAWGVIVIVVLWFRLGPPRTVRGRSSLLR